MKKKESTRQGKEARHAAILALIEARHVDKQDEIMAELAKQGFEVTQATVSRDIRELGIVKAVGEDGRYCYHAAPRAAIVDYRTGSRFDTIFRESAVSVDYAGHIVLVKCYSGMGNAACEVFDKLQWENVVGTLAGDGTFFILARTEADAANISARLGKLIRK